MYKMMLGGLLCCLLWGPTAVAQPIHLAPEDVSTLATGWDWARGEAPSAGVYWVGYSIRRTMRVHQYYGWNGRDEPSLHERLFGRPSPEESLWNPEQRTLDESKTADGRRVEKELALLYAMDARTGAVQKACVGSLAQPFDLEGRPLFWVGAYPDAESMQWLRRVYPQVQTSKGRASMVGAAGVHDDGGVALGFLSSLLSASPEPEVREKAAFWIGQTQDPAAVPLLLQSIRGDSSGDVREKAVMGLAQMDHPDALAALIDLAQHLPERDVRKRAVYGLGHKAAERTMETLQGLIQDDPDAVIRKHAVMALAQFDEAIATPALIELVRTHPDPQIRKQAIQWLSQQDDPRVVPLLVELVQGGANR